MRKSEVTPDFNQSFADLMQLGDKANDLMTRDAAELLPYGIDATFKTDTATLTQDLKDFPTDEELQGDVSDKTEIKDASADAVKVDIRSIMVRAKNGFGEASGKYRRFGTAGMDEMTDNDLLKCGKRVVRIAAIYQPQLASKGLTVAMIGALNTKVGTFDDNIDAQDDAIRLRDNATEDRLELGNSLYKKIVELFDFGKDYWVTRDEAKYNDYVIYETPQTSTQNFNINTGQIVNIKGSITAAAQVNGLKVKNISPSVAITLYVYLTSSASGGWTGVGYTVNPGQEVTLDMSQLGSLQPFLNVYNGSGGVGAFQVKGL